MMDLLRHRGFVLLWSGEFLGFLGDWALRTMLLIWVYQLTRSGLAVSVVGWRRRCPCSSSPRWPASSSTAGIAPTR